MSDGSEFRGRLGSLVGRVLEVPRRRPVTRTAREPKQKGNTGRQQLITLRPGYQVVLLDSPDEVRVVKALFDQGRAVTLEGMGDQRFSASTAVMKQLRKR